MSDQIFDALVNSGFLPKRQELVFDKQFVGRNTVVVPYDSIPKQYQLYLDDLAVTVFDPDGGRVIVTGDAMVGKTFMIEQLYGNRDVFLKRSGQPSIEFVKVTMDHTRIVDSLPGKWSDFARVVSNVYSTEFDDIVFVTEFVDAAVGLSTLGGRVILEASLATIMNLQKHENAGIVKQWASWEIVDLNDLFLKKDELIEMLSVATLDKINSTYPDINMTKKHIALFVNYAVRNGMLLIDNEINEDHAGMVAVPPGIMARAVGRLASLAAHSSTSRDRHGKLVLSRIIRRAFDDFEGLFFSSLQQYISSLDSDEMEDNAINEALRNALEGEFPGVRILSIQSAKPEKKAANVQDDKIQFSDMKTLKERLGNRILGQDSALNEVVDGLKIPAAGLNMETKPLRSFLFLGPTGVGKTELSLTLAKELYNEEIPLKRIDMSEFGQEHEAAKLLGAPPGYVGHEAGGVLTNFVKDNPRSIVILDEIEKANPKIWDSFLQVLDAGRMTDGQGDTVDFTKTIVIMTSNIGASKLNKPTLGFVSGTDEEQYAQRSKEAADVIRKSVEEIFRPEMINRIDQQVIFYELPKNVLRDVISRELGLITERIQARGYNLTKPQGEILDHIATMADASKYGAREIQRVIGKNIYGLLADAVLTGDNKTNLKLTLNRGELKVQATAPRAPKTQPEK